MAARSVRSDPAARALLVAVDPVQALVPWSVVLGICQPPQVGPGAATHTAGTTPTRHPHAGTQAPGVRWRPQGVDMPSPVARRRLTPAPQRFTGGVGRLAGRLLRSDGRRRLRRTGVRCATRSRRRELQRLVSLVHLPFGRCVPAAISCGDGSRGERRARAFWPAPGPPARAPEPDPGRARREIWLGGYGQCAGAGGRRRPQPHTVRALAHALQLNEEDRAA